MILQNGTLKDSEILKFIKENKIGWNSPTFETIKNRREEEDQFLIKPFEVEEGIEECRYCGSRRTYSWSKQTRSADEPMTTFVKCANTKCGKSWKYSG